MTDHMQTILNAMHIGREYTCGDVMTRTGIKLSRVRVSEILKDMADHGIIQRVGSAHCHTIWKRPAKEGVQ